MERRAVTSDLDSNLPGRGGFRTTWEYRALKFAFHAIVVLLCLAYLSFTAPHVWTWAQMKWARAQDISAFSAIVAKAERTGDFEWALRWIGYRPLSDAPRLVEQIEAHSAALPAPFFTAAARLSSGPGQEEDYIFWSMLARYRLRYDLLRCGNPEIVEKMKQVIDVLYLYMGKKDDLAEILADPQRLAPLLERVLDFDAKHPAHNNPAMICDMTNALNSKKTFTQLPETQWAAVRHTLRFITEGEIRRMTAAPAEAPKP